MLHCKYFFVVVESDIGVYGMVVVVSRKVPAKRDLWANTIRSLLDFGLALAMETFIVSEHN